MVAIATLTRSRRSLACRVVARRLVVTMALGGALPAAAQQQGAGAASQAPTDIGWPRQVKAAATRSPSTSRRSRAGTATS